MSTAELISLAIALGLPAVAALAAVLGVGGLLIWERRYGYFYSIAVVPIIALGISISSLLSGRDLKLAYLNIEFMSASTRNDALTAWLLRLLTICILGGGFSIILARVFRKSNPSPMQLAGQGLLLSFFFYYVGNAVTNAIFGVVPSFVHQSVYVAVLFSALYITRQQSVDGFLVAAKVALALMMVVSLVVAVIKPSVALEPGYRGVIPGLAVRLWGAGSNPNSIGPLALLLLLLEFMKPTRRWWARWVGIACALVVLVLAQSKTAWMAALAAAVALSALRLAPSPRGGVRLGFVLLLLLVPAAVTVLLMLGYGDKALDRLAGSDAAVGAASLSGRTQIWSAALDVWQQNPLFGYGPSAWGDVHRISLGMPFAFSAHNQFLQSLSSAGLFGAAGLLAFVLMLSVQAWRVRAATRGVSVALMLLALMRCVSEVPFGLNTLFNGDVLMLAVLFRICLIPVGAKVTSRSRPGLRVAPHGVQAV